MDRAFVECIRGCSATDGILLGLIVIDEGYGPRLCGQQCAEFGERAIIGGGRFCTLIATC